ncbi:MarR family winged helix-turn-helix transcriptional regulator [Paenibacillus sp. CN-4]|uniref:MarR family winged helix-turn-helix transcriptional regulator n=1 Tax=Paenibacillus nanchangensis TaxID=3348343 RepID=UPI00397AEBDA
MPEYTSPSIAPLLGSAYRKISTAFARALRPYDITPEQWSVLYAVCAHEGITQKEVADAADKDQPTTARIIELLLKKRYLDKSPSPSDGRAFCLYPTESGRQLIHDTIQTEADTIAHALRGLTSEQITGLRLALETIKHNLAP